MTECADRGLGRQAFARIEILMKGNFCIFTCLHAHGQQVRAVSLNVCLKSNIDMNNEAISDRDHVILVPHNMNRLLHWYILFSRCTKKKCHFFKS